MRFLRNALSGREPLLLEPSRAVDHARQCEKVGFTDAIEMIFGKPPQAYIEDGVAVIPVAGVIGKGLSTFDRMTGGFDLDQLAQDILAVKANPAVKAVVFKVNSPGGTVTGVEEVGNMIASLGKPTFAFTDGEMASAAYWLGSQADRVVVTPSSSVGSIGVYSVYYDFREALEAEGIKAKVFSAGTYKGMGIYGTSLTPEQEAFLQADVVSIWDDFKSAVTRKRSMVKPEDMEAQLFSGKLAAQKGLATALVNSFPELLAAVKQAVSA
jgi:signal peptide peptidase SppA